MTSSNTIGLITIVTLILFIAGRRWYRNHIWRRFYRERQRPIITQVTNITINNRGNIEFARRDPSPQQLASLERLSRKLASTRQDKDL